ncbi:MAG: type II toxin-antitoxin system HicA family toxin [Burkholderiaceae bacterium]|nr:type II toxin-antitoxin system HicA family toxin [Burkholderiaceae bacterium]
MVKKQKLLEKILRGSKNVPFNDLEVLLEAFGFVLERISGSHHIFKHPSVPSLLSLQPDRNGQAKPYQVRQFLALVEEYRLSMSGAREGEIEEDGD